MKSTIRHTSSTWSKLIGVCAGTLVLAWTAVVPAQGIPPARGAGQNAGFSAGTPTNRALMDAHRTMAAIELEQLNWPIENRAPKPYLREYLPDEALIRRAEDPLRMSAALDALYDDPVTPGQLQAEMEREAVATAQPERLRELWAALGNDPALIAEAVARPILAENRLRAHYFADEKMHAALKAQALGELAGLAGPGGLRALSGDYHEIEYRLVPEGERDNGESEEKDRGIERRDPAQWQELISSLGAQFRRSVARGPSGLAGAVSGLGDATEHFFVQVVLEAGPDRVRIGTMSWAKTPFTVWWEGTRDSFLEDEIVFALAQPHQVSLPEVPQKMFHQPEGWKATSTTGAPAGRIRFAWQNTGSVVVAWGGKDNTGTFLRSGGRYNPTTDSWQATSVGTNCPAAQLADTWAWTGTELVIWNGQAQAGGRYNPAADTWAAMSALSCPSARKDYSMVWSGTEVIVWGGTDTITDFNTGGKYNPTSNTWTATGIGGSLPTARSLHTATWDVMTGFMHIWGGFHGGCLYTGGIYKDSDTWYPMTSSGAPTARRDHTQVSDPRWGILVWGGGCSSTYENTGGWFDGDIYSPPPPAWHTITTTGAPDGRIYHAAIWGYNGSQMVIWGGMFSNGYVTNTGGRYNPQADLWASLTTTGAPTARRYAKGVDIASEGLMMVVWGGDLYGPPTDPYPQTGGIYTLCSENFPFLQSSPVTATDLNTCTQGIQITWKNAADWHDSGYGTRSYEIYRDGALLTTKAYGTTTYTDSATVNGTTYSYVVRYINGCGHSNDSGAVTASDSIGAAPSSLANNTAADVSACADSGVTVTWSAPGNWGDNGVGTRTFEILRGGVAIATGLTSTTTSYTDTTGVNGTSYTYAVRAKNGCALTTTTAGVSAMDYVAVAPSSLSNNTAADASACADTGVTINWTKDAGAWNDNGSGTRFYTVLRDGGVLVGSINYGTTSYTDNTGANGTSYTYSVRYNNGCSLNATTPGVSAVDAIGSAPSSVANNAAADVSACADTGVTINWTKDAGDWGDNGSGTRTYSVLRNVTVIAPSIAYGTTTYTDTTGTNGQTYTYRVQYNNGCGTSFTTDGVTAADNLPAAPSSLANNTAADVTVCADSGVIVAWPKDAGDWGDGGTGTRTYDVLRDGSPIASGIAYNTLTFTDATGVNGTSYAYAVRYNNGCGLNAATAGISAADQVSVNPTGLSVGPFADEDRCAYTGIRLSWAVDATDWGDFGVNPSARYYLVYRGVKNSGTCSVSPISGVISYGSPTTYLDTTAEPDGSYCYAIKYFNSCLNQTFSGGAFRTDADDITPCPVVGSTLKVVKAGTNAALNWTAVTCGDLANYRVYGATSYGAAFPSGWTLLGSPSGASTTDALNSAYKAYAVVTVDSCGNASGN